MWVGSDLDAQPTKGALNINAMESLRQARYEVRRINQSVGKMALLSLKRRSTVRLKWKLRLFGADSITRNNVPLFFY